MHVRALGGELNAFYVRRRSGRGLGDSRRGWGEPAEGPIQHSCSAHGSAGDASGGRRTDCADLYVYVNHNSAVLLPRRRQGTEKWIRTRTACRTTRRDKGC